MFIALNLQKQKIIECTLKMFSGAGQSLQESTTMCKPKSRFGFIPKKKKKEKKRMFSRSLCVDEK